LKTGVHKYTCAEDRAGIFVFGMNGTSTHQLSNIGLCYAAEGPFATEPNAELFAARLTERDYFVNIAEGNTLHWIQLGNATSVDGTEYVDGEEYSVPFGEAFDTREFEVDEENPGSKIIYCTKPGDLKMWTVLDENDAKSNDVVIPVTCEKISMPTPVATITNVEEGFAKEYTISADNSNTLLTPTVTINYVVKNAAGSVIASKKDAMTGEVVKMTEAGTLELYAWDGKSLLCCLIPIVLGCWLLVNPKSEVTISGSRLLAHSPTEEIVITFVSFPPVIVVSTYTCITFCTHVNWKECKLHVGTGSHVRHVQVHGELVGVIRKSSRIYTSPRILVPEIVEHTSTILLVLNLKILLASC
jgi:hypothetical protein